MRNQEAEPLLYGSRNMEKTFLFDPHLGSAWPHPGPLPEDVQMWCPRYTRLEATSSR